MKYLILSVFYIGMVIINSGALIASDNTDFPSLMSIPHYCRRMVSVDIMFALMPPFIILTPFFTGFYQDSLSYHCGNGDK